MKTKTFLFLFIAAIILISFFGVKMLVGSNEKLSREYDELFFKFGKKFNLDPKLLKALALNESSLGKNKGYEPKGGTFGLMQIKLSTAKQFLPNITTEDLKNDSVQIEAAAAYIDYLSKLFKGDTKKIIMSYNQGQGNTLAGKTYADEYYQRYLKHINLIG